MKITLLKYIFSYFKLLINWPWKKIEKVWAWIIQDPRNILTIINILLVIYALRLSIQNAKVSSRFQENVVQNLTRMTQLSDSLRNSLNALPRSMESFGSSIKGLNSVIEQQQVALNKSIGSLSENVDEFSKSLLSYKANLSKIVEATDKQIELLKKTQARWEEEISRKPDLYLVADSVVVLSKDTLFVHLRIENRGNMTAKNCHVNFYIPDSYQFIGEKWKLSRQEQGYKQYYYGVFDYVAYSPTSGIYPFATNYYFQFKLKSLSNSAFPTSLKYFIYEDKIGAQQGELKLTIP